VDNAVHDILIGSLEDGARRWVDLERLDLERHRGHHGRMSTPRTRHTPSQEGRADAQEFTDTRVTFRAERAGSRAMLTLETSLALGRKSSAAFLGARARATREPAPGPSHATPSPRRPSWSEQVGSVGDAVATARAKRSVFERWSITRAAPRPR
jgi:hypothetical protein